MEYKQQLKILSKRIKEGRINKGLTQKSLASKSGVSLSRLLNVESGNIKNIQISTLYKIANGLDVKVFTFFE